MASQWNLESMNSLPSLTIVHEYQSNLLYIMKASWKIKRVLFYNPSKVQNSKFYSVSIIEENIKTGQIKLKKGCHQSVCQWGKWILIENLCI